MSLAINGTTITPGDRPTFNDVPLTQINVNGTEVWKYDSIPPAINITSGSIKTSGSTYTITGTVTDPDSGVAAIKVNNVSIPFSGNSFSYNVGLNYGNNTITVTATDNAGNSSTASVTVLRYNASVITWDDTLTASPSPGATVNYSGNRNSANCSVNTSTTSYFAGPQSYASQSIASITVTGRIFAGTNTINISALSASRWMYDTSGMPDFGRPDPQRYAYIYNAAGQVVANLPNGSNNVSAYSDGSYFYKFYCGDGYYAASTHGAGASANISFSS
ncbi:hypothetical protein [Pseudobutyrivibrio sp. C4]|uniref:hypothetical protein n=1 Tax=Pseudobutyrivibrio sp. C4 TaxID=1520803 RepID=UPI000B8880FE|nr:hypothetical protein [Pseudobutyrivibrio sp. C4]